MNADWECFHRARQGNNKAWRELTSNHQKKLLSMALFITGSLASAEDIVQETFIRAANSKISNNDGSVTGYLGTITYRLALKELKRSRNDLALDNQIIDNSDSKLNSLIKDEQDRAVFKAINRLESKHKEIVVLRFYADHSYDKIAEILNISIGTVKSRIFYAVKKCREILKSEGFFNDTY